MIQLNSRGGGAWPWSKAPHEPSWLELARERAFQAELELALNWLEGLKAWLEKLEPTFEKLEPAREPIN